MHVVLHKNIKKLKTAEALLFADTYKYLYNKNLSLAV